MIERKIAQVLSYVFFPLLMPTYGAMILLLSNTYVNYTISTTGQVVLISMVWSLTFVFPSILILLMKRLKLISSIELGNREERTLPFVVVVIFFYLTYQLFLKYHLPTIFYVLLLSSIVVVATSLLINFLWKISAHMMGVGSIVGALIGIQMKMPVDYFWLIMLAVFLSGLVGFARLKLKSPTSSFSQRYNSNPSLILIVFKSINL